MEYSHLKNAVMEIHMPEEMKARMIRNAIAEKSAKAAIPPAAARKKIVAAAVAAILCLTLAVPALAATVAPVYELMYFVSPAIAQYFQPVQKSDVDNGIKMEVVSAYIHDGTAQIYVTMQDLQGDRIDETIDLYDSYSIRSPFDSSAHCERVGYDADTKTATFLISISQMGGHDIEGDKITFSVKQFLSHKTEHDGIPIPVDLTDVPVATETQSVNLTGGGTDDDGSFQALLPGAPAEAFPVNGINFTGMAFVNDKLHMQIAIEDRLNNDNHGYFYLKDAGGNTVACDTNYYFMEETAEGRTDYIEYVFSITPEALAECSLFGHFWISGQLTEGNWRITFPLEQE